METLASRESIKRALIVLLLFFVFGLSVCRAQEPLSFQWRVTGNRNGEIVLRNNTSVPLTAYLFEVTREPCNPIEAIQKTFRGSDAITTLDGNAVQPFTSRIEDLGASRCNKDGVSSPVKATFKAALFADGLSYGDKEFTDILLQHRKFRLQSIDSVIAALESGPQGRKTRQEYVALLEKAGRTADEPRQDLQRIQFSDTDPYQQAIRELTKNETMPLQSELDRLLAVFRALRAGVENALLKSK
jgi:hypothetical protein